MNNPAAQEQKFGRRKGDRPVGKRSFLYKIFRAIGLLLITLIILLAILVGIGRAYLDANPQIKDELTQKLGQRIGIGIQAKDIGVRWRWTGPEVTINTLELQDLQTQQNFITFEKAQVVLDIKRYLKTRVMGVKAVQLQGSQLFLQRRENNSLFFNGHELNQIKERYFSQADQQISEELVEPKTSINYPKGIFEIDDITFVYQDILTRREIRLEDVSSVINNNDLLLSLQISAEAEALVDELNVTLSTPNPELHDKLNWQILVDAKKVELAELNSQWVNLKPLLFKKQKPQLQAASESLQFNQGSTDFKVLMHYTENRIKTLNATVDMKNLELLRGSERLGNSLRDLDFRFSYEHDNDLLNFRIDQINAIGALQNWPKDNFIQFKRLMFSDSQPRNIAPIQRELPNSSDASKTSLEALSEASTQSVEPLGEINRTATVKVDEDNENSVFKNVKRAELKAKYINLTELSPLLEVFSKQIPNLQWDNSLDWQEVAGIVENAQLNLENPNNENTSFSDLSLAVNLSDFSIPSVGDSMSLSGLTGEFTYKENQGYLNLNSNNLVYENEKLFRNDIKLDTLVTNIQFSNALDQWKINTDSLVLENPDFLINTNLDILLEQQSSPVVDIQAIINPKNLERVKYYYPAKVMDDKLVTWLEDRVNGGTVDKVNFVLTGNLKDYPFRNGQGEYLTEFTVKNLNVNYADDWPAVRLEDADLVFKNESFSIDAKRAKTGNVASFPLKAGFTDLGKSPLYLKIDANLDAQKIEEWIIDSPLKNTLGESLQYIDVFGPTRNKIDLSLPLDNLESLSFNGQIDFSENDLKLELFDDKLTALAGTFNYTEETMYSDQLTAVYQGEKIEALIKPQEEDTLIELHTEAQLGSFLGTHFSNYVTGNSTVDAAVIISGQDGQGVKNIKLRSNLLGSGLVLPAPFAKSEDTLMPLNLNIDVLKFATPSERQQMRLSGNMGDNLLRARFDSTINNPNSDWSLRSFTVVGGDNESLFTSVNPEQPRVSVLGNFSHVDFDEWLDFLTNDSNAQTDEALEIGTINVNLKKLDAIGQSFPDTQVVLNPDTNEWVASVQNTQVDGTIKFPRPWLNESLIEANLEKYHLVLPDDDGEEISFDPREIPNVSIVVKDFQLASMPMGEANLRIKKEKNGARIERFVINNESFTIDGSGGWFKTTDGDTSLVSLTLNSTDLAKTLVNLGYAPAASASSADALIELSWPGSPFTDILNEVSGSISFKLLNGDIREVEPGAGRFLALLSIAQLPKRLSLDFRDVFNSGLRYDELSADFSIHQGQAYTNNMLMRGPVADLGVVGRVGLATQDFEQAAVVQADLGSSLPIAGALAGGLGVGAAMLIFSEIFKNPLKQATQVFYKIDGEWSNPQIVRTLPQNLEEIPTAPR